MKKPLEPVIKWSGSKRAIAHLVAALFPSAQRYFEPFVGGGALLPFRTCKQGVASDVITELIDLWKLIRDRPTVTAAEYEIRWTRLQKEGYTAYYAIRDSFNESRNPYDLLFLTRTCVNGLIRFNSDRNFNNSLHHTRPGISPRRLREVILQWSAKLTGVEFITADYRETLSKVREGDLVFLDPPYAGTKGRYVPKVFDFEAFYHELRCLNEVGAKWVLTFDGSAGPRFYEHSLPPDLYTVCLGLPTGNSPFTRLMGTGIDVIVESVYLNFNPPMQVLNQVTQFGNQQCCMWGALI